MRRLFILAIGLAIGIGLQALPAAAVSLSDLVQNIGSITSGDKLFNNFETDIDLSELNVTVDPINVGGEPGLRFSSTGILDPEEVIEGSISYTASIPSGTFLIHDFTVGIATEPFESVGFLDGVTLTYVGIGSPIEVVVDTFSLLSDHVDLGQAVALVNVDNFFIVANLTEGSITASATADNTFSQTPVSSAVPEPATVFLLGSGLLGIALARLRSVLK